MAPSILSVTELEFTIQSISKAFAYSLVLEIYGREKVLERVGVEPSGDAFNSIVFDPHTNRSFNPMVNAGAIRVTAMLREEAGDGSVGFMLDRFSETAGRSLTVCDRVYRSEAETGDRNRAIAYLLRNMGAISDTCEPGLDLYFQQCSIPVTACDLARMGATLANIGANPVTGRQVFGVPAVRDTLSVMLSRGMYDYSGNWTFDVGFPAKSGVGGGIVGVVNR
jgi:glutaminase